ncbi:dihydrolipoamide acetyltransferase family protein [Nocardioides sp.]|uniref:dihydrolipoamide acetyltransferase family protein n=1 Tax=Nocardioides sp. TaxID=35761 RepID=UPI0039E23E70
MDFRLPDVGEGLVEAELVSWQVAVGDTVKVNDVVCEIETAKSVVELPSPYAGVVTDLLVPVGETVPVGTPIIRISSGEQSQTDTPNPGEQSQTDTPNPGEQSQTDTPGTLVGYGPKARTTSRRARRAQPSQPTARPATHAVLAKPPVRALARELGVDLRTVTPTGPKGEVTAEDLRATSYESTAPATTSYDAAGRVTREPVKGVRKAMAEAMTASANTVPHVTIWTSVDVTATTRLVERLRREPTYDGIRVSPLLILASACIEALRRHPLLNSVFAGEEVVLRHFVNLGIAAATPRGLIVPNIKDADLLSLPDLGRAINRLTDIAREGKTQPKEQQGGTFTITNVGPFGMEGGTPIINPGESAILCLGAVAKRPWAVSSDGEDRLAIRDVCTLSLSFDHRHIDGAAGSAFLADVAAAMTDPSHRAN